MGYLLADRIAERVLPLKHAQKAALVQLARHADDAGRGVFAGDHLLALGLGSSEKHAERMLAQLSAEACGWLLDDGWQSYGQRVRIKRRRIPVERLPDYPLALDVVRAERDPRDGQPDGRENPRDGQPDGRENPRDGQPDGRENLGTDSVSSRDGQPDPQSSEGLSDSVSSLCELLGSEIHRHSPKAKPAVSSTAWRDDMRKLLELDGRTVDEIRAVIVHAQRDPFWQSRAARPEKVGQHFDTIAAQMRSGNGKPKPLTADHFTADQEAAAVARMHARISGDAKRLASTTSSPTTTG